METKINTGTNACTTSDGVLQRLQLGDAMLDGVGEAVDFGGRIAGGAEGVTDLIARQVREYISDPSGMFARDILADPGQVDFLHILVRSGQKDEGIAVGRVEVDGIGSHMRDEEGMRISVEVAASLTGRPG